MTADLTAITEAGTDGSDLHHSEAAGVGTSASVRRLDLPHSPVATAFYSATGETG